MYEKIILLSLLIYSNAQTYRPMNDIIDNKSPINNVDYNDKNGIYCNENNNFNLASEEYVSRNNVIQINNISELTIDFQSVYEFKFNDAIYNNDLIVNIHSINCYINISIEIYNSNNNIIKSRNNDTFSFRINSAYINNSQINITPITYLINEGEKEYYKNKTCPIIITNYERKQSEIPILNLINNANLYFDKEFKEIKFIYKIENLTKDSPIALSLTFNQKTDFEIIIKIVETGKEIINKIITNSANIMFEQNLKLIKIWKYILFTKIMIKKFL